jgi:hypothetical protein
MEFNSLKVFKTCRNFKEKEMEARSEVHLVACDTVSYFTDERVFMVSLSWPQNSALHKPHV